MASLDQCARAVSGQSSHHKGWAGHCHGKEEERQQCWGKPAVSRPILLGGARATSCARSLLLRGSDVQGSLCLVIMLLALATACPQGPGHQQLQLGRIAVLLMCNCLGAPGSAFTILQPCSFPCPLHFTPP